jgi:peptide/nickel transport system permease protein
MLQNAQAYLYSNPVLAVYPGLCIALTVLAFNTLGNALRDILDPRG